MAKDIPALLEQHQRERALVTVRRDDIDDAAIQGFVLALTPTLVVLQYVWEFHLDGLMVLRTGDITDVNCSRTDRFQRELLAREGLVSQVPFDKVFEVADWPAAVAQLAREFPLMILECEALDEPDFVVGRLHASTSRGIECEHFTGAANWDNALAEINWGDITCCRVATRYIDFYHRHFERLRLS